MSASLAKKRRAVKAIERYYEHYGKDYCAAFGRKAAWYRRQGVRARALAYRYYRRHGRWPWEEIFPDLDRRR